MVISHCLYLFDCPKCKTGKTKEKHSPSCIAANGNMRCQEPKKSWMLLGALITLDHSCKRPSWEPGRPIPKQWPRLFLAKLFVDHSGKRVPISLLRGRGGVGGLGGRSRPDVLEMAFPRDAASAFGAHFDHEMNKAENKLAGQKRVRASLSTEGERIDREKARRTNREVGACIRTQSYIATVQRYGRLLSPESEQGNAMLQAQQHQALVQEQEQQLWEFQANLQKATAREPSAPQGPAARRADRLMLGAPKAHPGTFPKFSSGTPEQTPETATAFSSFLIQ